VNNRRPRARYYVLGGEDGRTPVPMFGCGGEKEHRQAMTLEGIRRIGAAIGSADKIVAQTETADGIIISTVFLVLDHSHGFGDKPVLFETMAFNDEGAVLHVEELGQQRYYTWAEAETGHMEVVDAYEAWREAALAKKLRDA
jgi:hypothetical protein